MQPLFHGSATDFSPEVVDTGKGLKRPPPTDAFNASIIQGLSIIYCLFEVTQRDMGSEVSLRGI